MPQPLPEAVRAALDAGRKVEAVKRLRELSGLGLAESKNAVEAGHLPDGVAVKKGPSQAVPSGSDGFEFKPSSPSASGAAHPDSVLSPGEVPRSRLNLGWLLAVAALALAAWLMWM